VREDVKKERMSVLDKLFEDADISHFSPSEVIRLSNSEWQYDREFPPPKRILKNIVPTVKVADKIREAWSDAVVVYSGYRPNAYNEIIEGEGDSQHLYFRALDIAPANGDFNQFLQVANEVIGDIRSGGKVVGYGKYYNSKFIHIDTGYYNYQRNW